MVIGPAGQLAECRHTGNLRVGRYHIVVLFAMTGSIQNRVLVPFDVGTRRLGYYLHLGLVEVK